MRRIVSALGLARDKERRKIRSESTPALVHIPDSASSSGIRTPSDVDALDMLSVPVIHSASSSDSVANSVRSSRWLPGSLFRSLGRKRDVHVVADPVIEPEDDSSDSQSTQSSRPRSPPALLPPPAPPFASTGRRSSSPASSIYRAGLANVQRRAPPSRANLSLHAFTQPLVVAAFAPTPHPLRAPDPSAPLLFPRSISRSYLPPSHCLRIQLHRARVLRRLEEGTLSPAEESSILPFATRTPRSPAGLARRRPSPAEPEDAVADLGTRTGRWSRGLRRWVARPVFEDRVRVVFPTGTDTVRPARGLGTEMLDFSDGTLALAGLAIDSDGESDEDYAPQRPPVSPTSTPGSRSSMDMKRASFALGSTPERTSAKAKAPVVRGVRFADDDDATDGDDLPLAVLASVQKKRAEKEARARHDRHVDQAHSQTTDSHRSGSREREDAKGRAFAEQVARARVLRDSARQGIERPASFVREAETRRKTLGPANGLGSSGHVRDAGHVPGHARSGSGGGSASHHRRNTVGEGSDAVLSPTRSAFSPSPSSSGFLTSSSVHSPTSSGFTTPSSSPYLAPTLMPGLPSSAPSALPGFPPSMMHSNSFPRASRQAHPSPRSPLRASFNFPNEFGQPNLEAIMAQNQALMAQNQFLLQALVAPNPPFAQSRGGSSASGSRRSGTSARPGPVPVQRSASSPGQVDQVQARPVSMANPGSKSMAKLTSQPRHAHSKSESQRSSRLFASPAPPVPNIPTGVYSMRGRTRPAGEAIT